MVRSQQVAHSHNLQCGREQLFGSLLWHCFLHHSVVLVMYWFFLLQIFAHFHHFAFFWDFFKTLWPLAYRFASRHFCKICKSACNWDFLKSTDSSFHFCDGIDLTEWCSDRSNIQNVYFSRFSRIQKVYFSRCSRIIVAALLSIALISVMVPPSALLHLPIVPATFFLLHSPPEFTFLSAIFLFIGPQSGHCLPLSVTDWLTDWLFCGLDWCNSGCWRFQLKVVDVIGFADSWPCLNYHLFPFH